MIEILWQYDRLAAQEMKAFKTASEAQQALTDGNRIFAELLRRAQEGTVDVREVVHLSADDLGMAATPGEIPEHAPFAVVLGCADACAPVESIFWQAANDLFVVRVAGNTPGLHPLGSLDYAIKYLASVHLLVVLGHTGCGAVTAAVDAFLRPASYMGITGDMPLRSIVDSIMTAVCGASDTLQQVYGEPVRNAPGYRDALIDLSVIMNAALTAAAVRQTFQSKLGPHLGVVYGVLNLRNYLVGLPESNSPEGGWQAGLQEPPLAPVDFTELAQRMARSRFIAQRLVGGMG